MIKNVVIFSTGWQSIFGGNQSGSKRMKAWRQLAAVPDLSLRVNFISKVYTEKTFQFHRYQTQNKPAPPPPTPPCSKVQKQGSAHICKHTGLIGYLPQRTAGRSSSCRGRHPSTRHLPVAHVSCEGAHSQSDTFMLVKRVQALTQGCSVKFISAPAKRSMIKIIIIRE